MVKGWKPTRLDAACEVTSSKRIYAKELCATGVPFYRSTEIIEKLNGQNVHSNPLFISEERFQEILRQAGAPIKGDLLLTSRGTLGVPYLVSTTDRFHFADGNLTWFRNFKGLNSAFLKYFFVSPTGKAELARCVIGSSQSAYTIAALKKITVALPLPTVQRRIVDILSTYDELIENSQRRIKILEAMARALYREWFVHFRFPGHEKHARVSSPLGDIPKDWEVKPLGEIADIVMGLSPKGDTYNKDGDGTPLINGPVEFDERFTKQVKWTTAPTKFCREGDLIVCVRGSTTGKWVKSDGIYCLGRGVCGLSSRYQCFVDLLFENELPTLLGQTSGSTFPSWTGPQLKTHPVLSPPIELLANFEELAKPISAAVLKYSRRIQNLRQARDLLLPRLLSGQISITTEVNYANA